MQRVYLEVYNFEFLILYTLITKIQLVTVDFWYSGHSTKPLILVHCQWNNFDQVSQRCKPIFPPLHSLPFPFVDSIQRRLFGTLPVALRRKLTKRPKVVLSVCALMCVCVWKELPWHVLGQGSSLSCATLRFANPLSSSAYLRLTVCGHINDLCPLSQISTCKGAPQYSIRHNISPVYEWVLIKLLAFLRIFAKAKHHKSWWWPHQFGSPFRHST